MKDTIARYGRQHLLIVDDSEFNRRLLAKILEDQGYIVDLAGSGVEALAMLKTEKPDLILLDIVMPGQDGYEVCGLLKADPLIRDIPVIFISALETEQDKIGAFQVGGVDYITKPFFAGEVLARIETHLRLRSMQKQLQEQNTDLESARDKQESLLACVFPSSVAGELIATGSYAPRSFDDVTVCFADIVSFTAASSNLSPVKIIEELNIIFSAFDQIVESYGCERIKTIGDAYLVASGMFKRSQNHTLHMVQAARQMIEYLARRNRTSEYQWQVRVGIHVGNIVGGIVGSKRYLYDIFGDTVNVASRIETQAEPMKIAVSETIHDLLADHFSFEKKRNVDVKGKGIIPVYLVGGPC